MCPTGSPLTPRSRAALKDALIWNFSPHLWHPEQHAVILSLGLWSEAELKAEIEASRPRRARRR